MRKLVNSERSRNEAIRMRMHWLAASEKNTTERKMVRFWTNQYGEFIDGVPTWSASMLVSRAFIRFHNRDVPNNSHSFVQRSHYLETSPLGKESSNDKDLPSPPDSFPDSKRPALYSLVVDDSYIASVCQVRRVVLNWDFLLVFHWLDEWRRIQELLLPPGRLN